MSTVCHNGDRKNDLGCQEHVKLLNFVGLLIVSCVKTVKLSR